MSTKLTLREKLAQQARDRQARESKNTDVKSDAPKLEPTVAPSEQFRVATLETRVQKQSNSRKIDPKEIIISKPQLQPSKEMEPRLLTASEIDFLLEGIPIPNRIRPEILKPLLEKYPTRSRMNYSSDPDISYLIYTEMLEYQRFFFSEIKLTPSALLDFRNYITLNFCAARSIPGTSVGIQCADAVSAPITQSTLNTFHSSGTSKSISYGIEYLSELINASKDRKQTSNTIHFKNKFLGFDRVLEYRRKLVQINIGNLITDYDIARSSELSKSYWYPDYLTIYKTDISTWGLRLYLNPQLMFDYRISISELKDALIREQPGLITVVVAPTFENILDIYPVEAQIGQAFKSRFKEREVEATPTVFLHNLLFPLLDKMKIKGVDRITNLFPVQVPIWATIKTVQKLGTGTWNCIFDQKVLTVNKITPDRVETLLKFLDFKVLEKYLDRIVVQMPADYNLSGKELNPNEYILGKIDAEKEYLEDAYEKSEDLVYPYSELLDLSQYWIAETNGSNLDALFAIRELDHDILTTNDIHEAKKVFGIEGAKHILLKEFLDALDSLGSGTDPKHLILMTDFMTNKGEYLGFTKGGIEEQETSAYEQASFERANETLFNAAVFGERLPVTSVTSSVFVGAEAGFGTNYNRVVPTPKQREAYETIANNITKLSVADAESAMDIFDDPNGFTLANPELEIPGDLGLDFDPTIRRILTERASKALNTPTPFSNPLSLTIGLAPNRTNPNPGFTVPAIGLPTRFEGKIETEFKGVPAPIRSEMLLTSVNRISGVPRLDNPQPIHIPISTTNFYDSTLPVEVKSAVPVAVRGRGIPSSVGVPRAIGIPVNIGAIKTVAIPKAGGFDAIPVSGVTPSGISAVPIIGTIPALKLKGIPSIAVKLPTIVGKPIDISGFMS